MKKTVFLSLLAFPFLLSAASLEETLDEKKPITADLAEDYHNRLSVVDGRVAQVIANPLYFDVTINEKLGLVFVNAKKPLEEPQALSIVTVSGKVQDFLFKTDKIEPVSIFITEPEEPLEGLALKHSLANAETLCEIFSGKTPENYVKRDPFEGELLPVSQSLVYNAKDITVFEGALENLYVFEIQNERRQPLNIDLKNNIKNKGINWVCAPKEKLCRYETTSIVVSKIKD